MQRQSLTAICRAHPRAAGLPRSWRRGAWRTTACVARPRLVGDQHPLAHRRLFSQVALHLLALVAGHCCQLFGRYGIGALDPHLIVDAPVGDGAVAVVRGLDAHDGLRWLDEGRSLITEISLDLLPHCVKTYLVARLTPRVSGGAVCRPLDPLVSLFFIILEEP